MLLINDIGDIFLQLSNVTIHLEGNIDDYIKSPCKILHIFVACMGTSFNKAN